MGIMVYSLYWVMQDFVHQPYGALTIRKGFWDPLYYNYGHSKEPRNYLAPCLVIPISLTWNLVSLAL